MTIDQIITSVGTVGFPIVALIFLAKWVKDRIESSEKKSDEREERSIEREKRMGARIDTLEDFIRTEQSNQIDMVTSALQRNTEALDRANETMSRLALKESKA